MFDGEASVCRGGWRRPRHISAVNALCFAGRFRVRTMMLYSVILVDGGVMVSAFETLMREGAAVGVRVVVTGDRTAFRGRTSMKRHCFNCFF